MCTTKKELQKQVAKYRRLKVQQAELEAAIKECQEAIFEYLDANDIQPKQKVSGPNYIVSFSVCQHSSFDADALKFELGDDLSSFKKYTSFRRLTVK